MSILDKIYEAYTQRITKYPEEVGKCTFVISWYDYVKEIALHKDSKLNYILPEHVTKVANADYCVFRGMKLLFSHGLETGNYIIGLEQ